MDTVKTLVAFCHLQRAACAVWSVERATNDEQERHTHNVKGSQGWAGGPGFIVPLRRLPCHVNYIISLPGLTAAATPTRTYACHHSRLFWDTETFVVQLQLTENIFFSFSGLGGSTWLLPRRVCVISSTCIFTLVSIILQHRKSKYSWPLSSCCCTALIIN